MSNENEYGWAENPAKLERAVKEVNNTGKKFEKESEKEEAVKAVYVRLLGKVKGEHPFGYVKPHNPDLEAQLAAAKEEGRKEAMAEQKVGQSDAEKTGPPSVRRGRPAKK